MEISDTITAIATPPGRGGIGIVRVSGKKALSAMQKLFRSRRDIEFPEPNKLYYGDIIDLNSNIIDKGYAVFMKSPHSYTGEDTVEFHCHGSPAVLSRIISELNELGIRNAYPGEFTRRAFLNGKMDILQAEAILDLVNSNNENASKVALSQLKGDLSQRITNIKNEIIKILTNVDAIIDFPESVDEDIDLKDAERSLREVKSEIEGLISSYKRGRVLREGLLFQIVGKPNAGKSSLFNLILGKERAIVHPAPGTTRDYLEEELVINGAQVRLIDSAGIWDTVDEVEGEGIKKAMEIFNSADAFILVIDASQELTMEDRHLIQKVKDRRGIIALNKSDLGRRISKELFGNEFSGWHILYTSAKTGYGINELKKEINNLATELTPSFEPGIITKERHVECLESTLEDIKNALPCFSISSGIIIVSDHLHRALKHLGELTGEELNEKVLDQIFSQFCIGK